MTFCELERLFWRDHAQPEICSGRGTHQEQQTNMPDCTRRIRVINASCLSDFFCNWSATYPGERLGAPQHADPLEFSGQTRSLPHNCVGFLYLATLTNSSMPPGGHPNPFPHLVLPWWTSMCAWRLSSSLRTASTSATRPGLQVHDVVQVCEHLLIAPETPLDCF